MLPWKTPWGKCSVIIYLLEGLLPEKISFGQHLAAGTCHSEETASERVIWRSGGHKWKGLIIVAL